jgi:hypothetical protein
MICSDRTCAGRRNLKHLKRPALWIFFFLFPIAIAQATTRDAVPPELRGHWPAYGTTSRAITGDITLTKWGIIFQTGQRLRLSYMGTHVGVSGFERKLPAEIFRVRKPKDLVMFGGNRLCGGPAATYLTLVMIEEKDLGNMKYGYMPSGDVLELSVFSGARTPSPMTSETRRLCANFNYQKSQ